MDTITHALSGALLARATARTGAQNDLPLPRRVILGTLAAAFPDADFLLSLGSPIGYLLNHRGVTHSLLLLPLWAWLLAWLAALALRDRRGARPYFPVIALGIGIHILGDVITAYGTMIFAPVSDVRVALGTTFIIDLYFSGIVLAGLAASLVWRASRAPALAACFALLAYVGAQYALRYEAIEAGRHYARAQGLEVSRVSALARPVSPLHWTIVVEGDSELRYADVHLLRKSMPAPPAADAGLIERISSAFAPLSSPRWIVATRFGSSVEDLQLAREAWNQPGFAFYRWFSEFPVLHRIDRGNPSLCVWFQDLRFMAHGRAAVPFRYGMCREHGGPWRPFQLLPGERRLALD